MKFNFLWDEEKTRQLHRFQLYANIIGAILASLYGIFSPLSQAGHLALIIIPIPVLIFATTNLFLLKRSHQGLRLLLLILLEQVMAVSFMTFTGGFNSIVAWAPFVLLLFTVFQLGPGASIAVGAFTIPLFIGMQLLLNLAEHQPISYPNFFFYVGCFIAATVTLHNGGKQISLQFEAKRKLEQIDELKNQFITLSSHYLRTPLTVIRNYADKLEKGGPDDSWENRLEAIKAINGSSHDLDRLIEKFLTITSIEKGESKIYPVSSNLNELITNLILTYQDTAKTKGVTLIYQPPAQFPLFPFDTERLKEALENLIDNAIKFNKPCGSVTTELTQQDNNAVIKVSDTGVGINKEHLETIFSTFNKGGMSEALQMDKPGIGLGLYLAKLIIEAHGGKISVESEEGKGSIFTVIIPLLSQNK